MVKETVPAWAAHDIAGRRDIEPAGLSAPERAALSRRLYEVHRRIFSGVSARKFHDHVIEPPADTTRIRLFLAADDAIIGYCAIHRYWRWVQRRRVIVLRAEAGLMPEYRGRGATYTFGIIRAVREKLTHPATPVYYLGTLVHPSSYHLFCKYFPRVYPHPGIETPPKLMDIARELIDSFPDPAVAASDPFVRDVGWTTIETPQETTLNRRRDRPDVAFFRGRNPGYTQGHGLVVIVPITIGNVAAALLSRLRELGLIALGRRKAHL